MQVRAECPVVGSKNNYENINGQEHSQGSGRGAGKTGNQEAYEAGNNDHGAGSYHSDSNRVNELTF